MPKFSLGQVFVAVFALAVGLSIYRLPAGSWIDVPLAVVSFYFAASLLRHALATWRLLRERRDISGDERWGGRIRLAMLLSLAFVLVLALGFEWLAAGQLVLLASDDTRLGYLQPPKLQLELAVLAILAATGMRPRSVHGARRDRRRLSILRTVAVASLPVILVAIWVDQLLVWYLVYIAISAVEAAQPPGWFAGELNVAQAIRHQRFALASFAGYAIGIIALLVFATLVRWWSKPKVRCVSLILLAACLAGELGLTWWIVARGIRQLSPAIAQAIQWPPMDETLVVATMLVSGAAAFAWRALARPASVDVAAARAIRRPFLHESWLGALLVGVFAAGSLASFIVEEVISRPTGPLPLRWQDGFYIATSPPAHLISVAAIIAGFAMAWSRWLHGVEMVDDSLPTVNPMRWGTMLVGLVLLAVLGAPSVAAAGFSCWFFLK